MRRKPDPSENSTLTVRMPNELYLRVRQLSEKEGESMSTVTRSLLKGAIERTAQGNAAVMQSAAR
jgi:predicted DNA-binding protein